MSYGGGSGSGSIQSGSDVALNNPTDAQVLGYNGSLQKWQNQTVASGAFVPTAVKTASYTANPSELIPVDATSNALTITLPTAPVDKTRVLIKKIDVTANTVTVTCGGSDVLNKSAGNVSLSLSLLNQSVNLQYAASSAIWYVAGDNLPLSQLDTRYPLKSNNLGDVASVSAARINLKLPAYHVNAYGADPTGATASDTAIAAAMAALGTSPGFIEFGAGTYLVNSSLGVLGAQQGVKGAGRDITTINFAGTGDCIRAYRANYQTGTANKTGGVFTGFTIDGSSAGAGSTGIHYGDLGSGFIENVTIRGFVGSGSIGLYMHNISGWAERTFIEIFVSNCTQQIVFDGNTSSSTSALCSFDYSTLLMRIQVPTNCDGIVLKNGAIFTGCRMEVTGNFTPDATNTGNTGTGLIVGATSSDTALIRDTTIHWSVESGRNGINHKTMSIGTLAKVQASGLINFFQNGSMWQPGTGTTNFIFDGYANIDSSAGVMASKQASTTIGGTSSRLGTISSTTILVIPVTSLSRLSLRARTHLILVPRHFRST